MPPPPIPKRLIPTELVEAYASLFDDPAYSDVVFRIVPEEDFDATNGTQVAASRRKGRERRIYASKKVLSARSEYFDTMFNSG